MCGKYYFPNFFAQLNPSESLLTQLCGVFSTSNNCYDIEALTKKDGELPTVFSQTQQVYLYSPM